MPSDSYQGVHRLLGVAVSGEGDHVVSVSDSAQPAAFARHVVSDGGRAAEHGTAGVSLPRAASLGGGHHGDGRQIVGRHHGISDSGILGADVDGETVRLGEFQRLNVLSVESVVSIGEALLALVGEGECHHGNSIDDTLSVRQVTRHVMAPQLPLGEATDAGQQGIPVATTLAVGHCLPVDVLGTALGVATLDLERAGIGAGLLAAGGRRDGASLAVRRAGGQSDLSGGHLAMAVDVAIIGGRRWIVSPLGQFGERSKALLQRLTDVAQLVVAGLLVECLVITVAGEYQQTHRHGHAHGDHDNGGDSVGGSHGVCS